MEKKDEELIQSLFEREPELKRHYDEHVDLERRLAVYQQKVHLKLAGKDKIMEILARYRPH
ncbi:MAG: DUF465 domain-containing protein [Deltaproteobacteria bacterium]|nr:MAG: DUF465 domain-containing protein [Deltaproteobacteria bacterium]